MFVALPEGCISYKSTLPCYALVLSRQARARPRCAGVRRPLHRIRRAHRQHATLSTLLDVSVLQPDHSARTAIRRLYRPPWMIS